MDETGTSTCSLASLAEEIVEALGLATPLARASGAYDHAIAVVREALEHAGPHDLHPGSASPDSYVELHVGVADLERIRETLVAFRRSEEVDTDVACALADLLESIVAPHVALRYAACSQCGEEFVYGDGGGATDDLTSTYCGSFCATCLPAHLEECEICRGDFEG
jgi:hypothetical protein